MTTMKIKQAFSAFGVAFLPDSVVDAAIGDTWPAGTLDRRVKNDFVEFTGQPETHVLASVDGETVYVPAGTEVQAPAPAPTPATPATPTPVVELTEEQKFQALLDEEEKKKAEGN